MPSLDDDEGPEFQQIDWTQQSKDDDRTLAAFLSSAQESGTDNSLFDPNRPLEGEKADGALDYEDISDNDSLPEETEATLRNDTDGPGLTDDNGTSHDADDDLFGEGRGSSPLGNELDDLFGPSDAVAEVEVEDLVGLNFPEYHRGLNQDPNIPAV